MAFYADMQAMVKDLLKSDSEGGLGQGEIYFIRRYKVAGSSKLDLPVVSDIREPVVGAVTGAAKWADGKTILETDYACTTSVPAVDWLPNDESTTLIEIDGKEYTVVETKTLPPAGTSAAVRFFLR